MSIRRKRRDNKVTVIASPLAEGNLTVSDWDWISEMITKIMDFLESRE